MNWVAPIKDDETLSQHDDGEGFVINSDGKADIWDIMPEPELRKLEPVLAREVEYGHWKRDITEAKTVEAVRDVRFSLGESEHLIMTREQIGGLHRAINHKETMLATARKAAKQEEKEAGKILEAKKPQPYESTGNPEIGKAKIR